MIQIKRTQRPSHKVSHTPTLHALRKAMEAITETFTFSAIISTYAKAKTKFAKANSFFAKAYAMSCEERGVVSSQVVSYFSHLFPNTAPFLSIHHTYKYK